MEIEVVILKLLKDVNKTFLLSLTLITVLLLLQGCVSSQHDKASYMSKFKPSEKFQYSEKNYINYEKNGNGRKNLIFLHGFGCSLRNWDDVIDNIVKKYPEEFTIYALDLRGMGFSSVPDDKNFTIKENAKIVSEFIKKLGIRNPAICGHSLGGGTALYTAVEYLKNPEFSQSHLILIDTACYPTEFPFFVKSMRVPLLNDFLLNLLGDDYRARKTLDKVVFNKDSITPEVIERYKFFHSLPGHNYALKQTAYNILPENPDELTSQFRNITVPTLILWGDHDTVLQPELGKRLHKDIKNSKLVILKDCGHNTPEEYPEKTAELICNFILSEGLSAEKDKEQNETGQEQH